MTDKPDEVKAQKEVVVTPVARTVTVKLLLKRPVEGAFVFYNVNSKNDVRFLPHERKYFTMGDVAYDAAAWEKAAKVVDNPLVDEALKLVQG